MAKYNSKAVDKESTASGDKDRDLRRAANSSATASVMQNPTASGSPKASFNSSARADLIGFANRSERVTQVQSSYPTVIPKLGYAFAQYAMHAEGPRYPDQYPHPEYYAQWDTSMGAKATPGIMALTFEPIMALESPLLPSELATIFQSEHMEMRIFNNATRGFTASDLHVMWLGLAELNCHIQNIKRILKVVAKMVNHEMNEYYSCEAILSALGFPMSMAEARKHYVDWYAAFNVDIIDQLKRIKWFKDERIMPGWKRWGAMCSEIYKDTPMYTDYCQMYAFRRDAVWDIRTELNEQEVFSWVFQRVPVTTASPTQGATAFSYYISNVKELVKHLFFDPGVSAVISCINTLYARNNNSGIEFSVLDFGNTVLWEEDLPLTYNFNMLLAIHNASIVNAGVMAPTVDVLNDRVRQTAYVTTQLQNDSSTTGCAMFLSPKLINMPNFGVSMNDMIDATQWTVVGSEIGATTGPGDYGISIVPGSCGTELITSAIIYYYNWTYEGEYTPELRGKHINGNGILLSNASKQLLTELLGMMQDFAFAPILYAIDNTGGYSDAPIVLGPLAQTEVEYVAEWNHLSEMHRQFVRNFWGYPSYPEVLGSFTTSYENAQR